MTRAVRTRMSLVAVAAMTLAGGAWSPVGAQPAAKNLEVTAPAPVPEAPAPGLGLEATRPPEERAIREQQFYPGLVRSTHEPAFVTPFVKMVPTSPTEGLRVGLSGWTAPAVPYDIPQATGGVAFGLTFSWWAPAPVKPAATPPPTRR